MTTSDNPWGQVPIGARPPGWIEATENGWGAVAAWFAGVENLVREPRSFEGRSIEVIRVGPDGTERSGSEALTAADMESIDDDILSRGCRSAASTARVCVVHSESLGSPWRR